MLDILQLRIKLDALDQLRLCQATPRSDCHAAFTVTSMQTIWPVARWDEIPASERINVRGWFPLLDQIADEFLIWQPHGGCFFVHRDRVVYRVAESDSRGVLLMQLELERPIAVVPRRPVETRRAYSQP